MDELVNKQSCWIINNTLVFIAGQRYNNWELWKSDGSSSGTTLLMDINQDTINGSLSIMLFEMRSRSTEIYISLQMTAFMAMKFGKRMPPIWVQNC